MLRHLTVVVYVRNLIRLASLMKGGQSTNLSKTGDRWSVCTLEFMERSFLEEMGKGWEEYANGKEMGHRNNRRVPHATGKDSWGM